MESAKTIKRRMRSVKNISQIAKAMEVVSATKMRKAQELALRTRPYAAAVLGLLKNLASSANEIPALFKEREIKKSLLVVITSDKGLAGAFNANVLKKASLWAGAKKESGTDFKIIAVGKKASDYAQRKNFEVHRFFSGFGDFTLPEQTKPLAEAVMRGYHYGAWDEAEAVYTNFRTTLKQEAVLRRIIPLKFIEVEETVRSILPERGKYAENRVFPSAAANVPYTFEPSAEEILNDLMPELVHMFAHHLVLESNASEHSARMVAMKSAADSARELMDDLRLFFNKARQAEITKEILEVTAGKEAMENV